MNTRDSAQGVRPADNLPPLPRQVQQLFSREREVAMLVYGRGSATANDVQARLSTPISNGAVRSMLQRLVGKGILVRRRRGRHGAYVYLAALTTAVIREKAMVQLADDYFAGSLHRAAIAMVDLLRAQEGVSESRRKKAA